MLVIKYAMSANHTMLYHDTIISHMDTLGRGVQETYDVLAVGGTSLVLHNIKESTDDVDFIVERGDTMRFEMAYKSHCGTMIDVSAAGECFGTRLPEDYVSQSTYIGTFGGLTLRALSVIDTIITKATRSSRRDMTDIRLCADSVSAKDVRRRFSEYSLGQDSTAGRTIYRIYGA